MKLIFDAEMTGTDVEYDELLQLSIINEYGEVLFNEYFKPEYVFEWPKAQDLTGISPLTVADKPPFDDYRKEVQELFDVADELIGYNTPSDIAFLRKHGIRIPNVKITDVMVEFGPIFAKHLGKAFVRNQKLETCAKFYDYEFTAHDSLNDAKATLHCYNKMHGDNWLDSMKNEDGMWSF